MGWPFSPLYHLHRLWILTGKRACFSSWWLSIWKLNEKASVYESNLIPEPQKNNIYRDKSMIQWTIKNEWPFDDQFEDTKGVIIICIVKKNRQHNGQKKKSTKSQTTIYKHTHNTKDRVTRPPYKTRDENVLK